MLFLLLLVSGGFSARGNAAETGTPAPSKDAPASKESFNLILPFKDLTVGQGQEATMDAEVVNRTKEPVEVSLTIEGVPSGWDVNFNSRYPSFPVRSVMVQGGDQTANKSTTLEFKAKIPDSAKPGTYPVKVTAKDSKGSTQYTETINYRVTSKKVDTGGIKISSQYPVLTSASGQTLKFTIDLKNETNKPLPTNIVAQAPQGWTVRFKPQFGDQQISSIQLKENGSETLSVEIDTPASAEAKEYPITIQARAGAFEAAANVKVSLKGTQDLKMGSLAGTLNTSVIAGTKTPIDFVIGNAGTAPIRNLNFVTKKPSDKWTVEFRPDKIDALGPGEVRQIKMEILAPERTIAGDYMLTLTANSPETNKSADFRVTVSTPTIWGWIGFAIVGLVVLGLAAVFFRLGRR
ncbi:MAG TPA: NEW3 domain-containing protein [Candidatus Binatia bacterium]|nr:NEW3 domain-containing protein [Candidatus Binatia bacterium]